MHKSSSSSSSESSSHTQKRTRDSETRPLDAVRVHIIQAKMGPDTVAELLGLVDAVSAVHCSAAEDAEVLVTAITMRARLERHVSWALAVSPHAVCIAPSH